MSPLDRKAILLLRDQYLRGETSTGKSELQAALEIEYLPARELLLRLTTLGVVSDDTLTTPGVPFTMENWLILPAVVDVAAKLETPPDRVQAQMSKLRSHHWGWIVVAVFLILVAISTLLANIVQIVTFFRAPK